MLQKYIKYWNIFQEHPLGSPEDWKEPISVLEYPRDTIRAIQGHFRSSPRLHEGHLCHGIQSGLFYKKCSFGAKWVCVFLPKNKPYRIPYWFLKILIHCYQMKNNIFPPISHHNICLACHKKFLELLWKKTYVHRWDIYFNKKAKVVTRNHYASYFT